MPMKLDTPVHQAQDLTQILAADFPSGEASQSAR